MCVLTSWNQSIFGGKGFGHAIDSVRYYYQLWGTMKVLRKDDVQHCVNWSQVSAIMATDFAKRTPEWVSAQRGSRAQLVRELAVVRCTETISSALEAGVCLPRLMKPGLTVRVLRCMFTIFSALNIRLKIKCCWIRRHGERKKTGVVSKLLWTSHKISEHSKVS